MKFQNKSKILAAIIGMFLLGGAIIGIRNISNLSIKDNDFRINPNIPIFEQIVETIKADPALYKMYGGAFLNENGGNIYWRGDPKIVEKLLYNQKVTILRAKYSYEELLTNFNSISENMKKIGFYGIGINEAENNIEVLVETEQQKSNLQAWLKKEEIPQDMVVIRIERNHMKKL